MHGNYNAGLVDCTACTMLRLRFSHHASYVAADKCAQGHWPSVCPDPESAVLRAATVRADGQDAAHDPQCSRLTIATTLRLPYSWLRQTLDFARQMHSVISISRHSYAHNLRARLLEQILSCKLQTMDSRISRLL